MICQLHSSCLHSGYSSCCASGHAGFGLSLLTNMQFKLLTHLYSLQSRIRGSASPRWALLTTSVTYFFVLYSKSHVTLNHASISIGLNIDDLHPFSVHGHSKVGMSSGKVTLKSKTVMDEVILFQKKLSLLGGCELIISKLSFDRMVYIFK